MEESIRRPRPRVGMALCLTLVAVSIVAAAHTIPRAADGAPAVQAAAASKPQLYVDAVVVDRKGSVVRDMKPADFFVTSDAGSRRIVSLIPFFRGPGAAESARLPRSAGSEEPRIEPARVVLFVVDQASLLRGDEGRVGAVVETCLGLLGFGDHVGLMVLPGPSGSIPMRRDEIRGTLAKIKAMRTIDGTALDSAPKPGGAIEPPVGVAANPTQAEEGRTVAERAAAGEKLDDLLSAGRLGGEEAVSAAAAREHALTTLAGLTRLLQELGRVAGSKTIFLLSAGLSNEGLADEFDRFGGEASRAEVRIYALQVPTPARKFADIGRPGLEALARLTGGALVSLGSKPGEALQRTIAELAFSYLLVLEPIAGSGAPGRVAISVKPRRGGVTVRSAAWVVAGRPLPSAAPEPRVTKPAAQPPPVLPSPVANPAAWKRDPAIDVLLARAGEYMQNYWNEVSALVAEEAYEQRVFNPMTGNSLGSRKLVSDFLLVKVPGDMGWLPFRDVFEVDGQQVRERQNRLQKLFVEAPTDRAIQNADAIFNESARYNIGSVHRNLNVPTLALMFVFPTTAPRFEFKKSGEETIGGMRTWVVEYREIARPTIIKTSANGNVPAAGRFWIEPASGRIAKTELVAGGATISVTYRPSKEARDVWFPATMDERYARSIVAKATYSKIRRFQVFTDEKLKDPK